VAIREVEDWGFEAEESLPPALPADAIQVATEDPNGPAPETEHRAAAFSGAATLAMLTVGAALILIWVSGIGVLIWWAVGALFG
jgi:hypothetical protein